MANVVCLSEYIRMFSFALVQLSSINPAWASFVVTMLHKCRVTRLMDSNAPAIMQMFTHATFKQMANSVQVYDF